MKIDANIYEIEIRIKRENSITQQKTNTYSCLGTSVNEIFSMIPMIELPYSADFIISVKTISKEHPIYISPNVAKLIREGAD